MLFFWNELTLPISFVWERIFNLNPVAMINIKEGFLWKLGLNSSLSLLFGFLLWREGVVAAGDVKLFFVFSFLLPTKYYWKSYLPLFPSFALLVNIFVIILVFILCRSLFCFFLKFKNDRRAVFLQSQKRRSFSIKKQVVQTIGMLSIFLLFFWIKHWINSYLGLDIGKYQYLFLVLMIMFSRKITKALFKNNNFLLILAVSLNLFITAVGLFINFGTALNNLIITIKMMVVFLLVMSLSAKFLNYYVRETGVFRIEVDNLLPGMMINSVNTKQLNDDQKFVKDYGRIISGGISKNQVGAIICWAKTRGMKTIEIYKKFPLAPWIFAGVISIILFKQSFINIVLDFVR